MVRSTLLVVCAGALIGLSGTTSAAADQANAVGRDPAELFAEIDANKDGQLAAGEVSEDKRRLFQRLLRTADKNGDGQLSRDEFVAGLARQRPDAAAAPPAAGNADAPPPRDPIARFRQLDANGDGKIQLDEFPEQGRPFFEKLLDDFDEDGDDALSPAEFRKAGPTLRQQFAGLRPGGPNGLRPPLFAAIDVNGDGILQPDEIAQAATALKKLDRNADGSITPDEIGPPPGFPPGGPQGSPSSAGAGPNLDLIVNRIMQADANGDGKLSRDETPERLKNGFDKIDANGDGLLDVSEIRERLSAMQSRLGGKLGERFKPANP